MDNKKLLMDKIILSLMYAIGFYFFIPAIYERTTLRGTQSVLGILMILFVLLLEFAMLVILRIHYFRTKDREMEVPESIVRILRMFGIQAVIILVMSIFSGLIATFVYRSMRGAHSLDAIKWTINLYCVILAILAIPFMIYLFWITIKKEGEIIKETFSVMGVKKYMFLVILFIAGYGIGTLFTVICGYIKSDQVSNIIKVIIVSVTGIITFLVSEQICDVGQE